MNAEQLVLLFLRFCFSMRTTVEVLFYHSILLCCLIRSVATTSAVKTALCSLNIGSRAPAKKIGKSLWLRNHHH